MSLIGATAFNSVAFNSLPDTPLRIQTAKAIALAELIETGGRHPLHHKGSLEYFLKHSFDKPLPREMQLYFLTMVRGFVKPPRGRPKYLSRGARDKLIQELYPIYLRECQVDARRQSPSKKGTTPKSDRVANSPHQFAAERIAAELKNYGFHRVSVAHILNLASSEKR